VQPPPEVVVGSDGAACAGIAGATTARKATTSAPTAASRGREMCLDTVQRSSVQTPGWRGDAPHNTESGTLSVTGAE
jgi:hypothetical protein